MRIACRLLQRTAKSYVDHYSKYHPLPLSIQQFVDFGAGMSKNIVVVTASCQFNVIDVIVVCVCSKNACFVGNLRNFIS